MYAYMSGRKIIQVTVDIDREVWFRFRALVHANGLSLNRAVEGVLRETLKSAGIEIKSGAESASGKVEGPMVRP